MKPIPNENYRPLLSCITFPIFLLGILLTLWCLLGTFISSDGLIFYGTATLILLFITIASGSAWWKQSDSHHVCSDCRGKISPKAKICPHCRAPAESH